MPQAPNKLRTRAEVRYILIELRNERAMSALRHRDAYRHDVSHDEKTCMVCQENLGAIEALESAVRHFGGRRG